MSVTDQNVPGVRAVRTDTVPPLSSPREPAGPSEGVVAPPGTSSWSAVGGEAVADQANFEGSLNFAARLVKGYLGFARSQGYPYPAYLDGAIAALVDGTEPERFPTRGLCESCEATVGSVWLYGFLLCGACATETVS